MGALDSDHQPPRRDPVHERHETFRQFDVTDTILIVVRRPLCRHYLRLQQKVFRQSEAVDERVCVVGQLPVAARHEGTEAQLQSACPQRTG